MNTLKDQLLMVIEARARRRLADLSREFARAPSEEKEAILAGIEFEKWFAEACGSCLAR